MATTTNFGWETPDDTDLVKDGALAIRTLGSAIDTSLVDLKGGTTGQVLSKTSNTDMDFTWVAQDDSNAIQNAIVDAKGDLIAASAADTPARLAVGANGTVLTADSAEATGLKWATPAGGWTLLTSGTLSGATTTTASFSTSYIDLRVIITNFLPATDNAEIQMRFNADSNANRHSGASSFNASNVAFTQTEVIMATGNDNSVASGLIIIDIPSYSNTTTWKIANSRNITVNSTTTTSYNVQNRFGAYNQTSAISSLSFLCSSGNFTSGNYLVYGA